MADDTKTKTAAKPTTPPAAAAEPIDYERLAASMTKAFVAASAETNKPILEALQSQAQAKPAAAAKAAAAKAGDEGDAPQGLTEERMAQILDERDRRRDQQRQAQDARRQFEGEKLNDLPPAYRRLLGDDPAKFVEQAADIRAQYEADHRAAGNAPKDVGGKNPGGRPPAEDRPDMSAQDRLLQKMNQEMVAGAGANAQATA